MSFEIELVREAKEDLKRLRKTDQVKLLDRIERHLSREPARQSRSRIKRLGGAVFPPFRLRVDEFRVYYDVDEAEQKVVIYGVIRKADAESWLARSTSRRRKHEDRSTE
ncbi:MAG: type II toxin-antitoxin system RelE family toxin [Blastocatellia bacterium]